MSQLLMAQQDDYQLGAKTSEVAAKDSGDSGHERATSSSTSLNSDLSAVVQLSDDAEEEEFQDATCSEGEAITLDPPSQVDEESSLDLRLNETSKILRLALDNEFAKALSLCAARAHKELYAGLAHATLSFLRATLTLDPQQLKEAVDSIHQVFNLSASKRKRANATSIVFNFIYRPNYELYSDDQVHAELVHAESLILLSLISFLSDQSIICLVKGAFRIRSCYQRYKECLYIMQHKRNWQTTEAREHFESGVRMGLGIFNLLMSYLPPKVLRLLEYVGFSGNRSVGVDELEKSVALGDGLRSVFSSLVILTHHSYVENLFGLGNYDAEKVDQLCRKLLNDHPNSAFFLLFRGRYHQMQGQLDLAIDNFQRCIEAQNDWIQFHSICHWEIMWCKAVQMDWEGAAHYSDLLRRLSKWSPASYTYQYATFLYAKLTEERRAGEVDAKEFEARMKHIKSIMRKVPSLRIRYAGKTIPAEKFAIMRSIEFCERKSDEQMTLPALEFLYIWNIFVTLKNSPEQVGRLLTRIDHEIQAVESSKQSNGSQDSGLIEDKQSDDDDDDGDNDNDDNNNYNDNNDNDNNHNGNDSKCARCLDAVSLLLLLRGMCLKQLNRLDEAEQSFLQVVANESRIESDTFIVPHTIMELALVKLQQKDLEAARRWAKKAKSDYTGYLHEMMVHFRIHATNRAIRIEQLGGSSGSSSSDSSP